MIKMKANDTLHISNVGSENIQAGDTFEVTETDAKQLEDRGYAKRVGAAKSEAAPAKEAADKAPISAAAAKPDRKGK